MWETRTSPDITPQGWPFVATLEVFLHPVTGGSRPQTRGIGSGNRQPLTTFSRERITRWQQTGARSALVRAVRVHPSRGRRRPGADHRRMVTGRVGRARRVRIGPARPVVGTSQRPDRPAAVRARPSRGSRRPGLVPSAGSRARASPGVPETRPPAAPDHGQGLRTSGPASRSGPVWPAPRTSRSCPTTSTPAACTGRCGPSCGACPRT